MKLLGLALVAAGLAGCSCLTGGTQSVTITASDPAAEIIVQGNRVGIGTATVDLQRDESHVVMARSGDRVGTATINTRISGRGIFDITTGCLILVPLIGTVCDGFRDLDPRYVVVVVPPLAGPLVSER